MSFKFWGIVLALLIFSLTLQLSLNYHGIWINLTSSMPQGIYKAQALVEKKDQAVLACLDDSYARIAKQRDYIGYGDCPSKSAPVGKYLKGLPGDFVRITNDGISINGSLLKNSKPKAYDGKGRALNCAQLQRILNDGEFVLASESPNSYDSRYFGVVKRQQLRYGLETIYLF